MGFFKSINDLNKQAKEMDKTFHPGQMMADGQAKMPAATEMMAAQTNTANASANGLDASATVVAVRQGSAMINFQPLVEIDLTVLAPGRPPYPLTVKQVVGQVSLARLTPGAAVAVKVDPADATSVWIDLMGAVA